MTAGSGPAVNPIDGATHAAAAERTFSLPEGEFTIPAEYGHAVRASTGATTAPAAPPHAALASVATLAASGIGIGQLLELAGASVADGPMLGECDIVVHRRLRYEVRYRVTRRFVSMQRKRSARLGSMDVFVFVASLIEPEGPVAAEVGYTWILPKGKRA